MALRLFVLCVICFLSPAWSYAKGNQYIESFSKAKKYAAKIWAERPATFYCGCSYQGQKINSDSCGYKPKRWTTRSESLEWEHIVPVSRLGASMQGICDNRRCLRKVSRQFRLMEADLYNLAPSIGTVNAARSNYDFADILGERRDYGNCDFEVSRRKVEPKFDIRGDIARTYFYMAAAYPDYIMLSEREKKLFEKWAKDDPVDDWERKRAVMIERIQGNKNRFIDQ